MKLLQEVVLQLGTLGNPGYDLEGDRVWPHRSRFIGLVRQNWLEWEGLSEYERLR